MADREVVIHSAWRPFYESTGIPAAVRAGEALYLTGHAGEDAEGEFADDVETQVRAAFRNVADTLHAAGADWSDVLHVTSYHVGVRQQVPIMLDVAAEFLERPFPAWMAVGVAELLDEGAIIDMTCVAVVGGTAAQDGAREGA